MKSLTLLALVGGVGLSLGSAFGQQVWCVGESIKVKPGDQAEAKSLTWNGSTKTVTLGSARNEYVAFQVAIRGAQAGLKDVTVVASDLKAEGGAGGAPAVIPSGNIDLFVEHYLKVKTTSRSDPKNIFPGTTAGEHPTQMVPFSARKYGAPFAVEAGRNQPVWVDVYVPEDAVPGVYRGTFTVKAGATVLSEINVALTVWNFALPQETHFRSFLYTGPENLRWGHHLPAGWDDPSMVPLLDAYFQMAHQHRLNFHPAAENGLDETLVRFYTYYDGSGFRQRVGKGVGQNLAVINPEGDNEQALKNSARKIVADCAARNFKTMIISYMWDEPHADSEFAQSKQRCKWVHEVADKQLLTFIATPQWQRYDAGDVNIYSEPAAADIPKIVARGDAVWAVNGGYAAGPYVDSPGFGGRSIVLMNWKMKLGGWQFWDCCYWVDKQSLRKKGFSYAKANAHPEQWLTDLWNDPMTFDETRKPGYPERDAIRINGDGVLFYPGYEAGIAGPIASYQMKSLRRGAQDYEYLWLLRQKGKEKEAAAILDTVCPAPGKWNENPESWDMARLEWARLLSN